MDPGCSKRPEIASGHGLDFGARPRPDTGGRRPAWRMTRRVRPGTDARSWRPSYRHAVTNHTPGAVTGAGAADREAGPIPVPPLSRQLQPRHWVAIDGVVAVLLAVVFLVGSTHPAYGIPIWVAYVLALVSTLPAAVRRIWPLPVLGLVLAGSVASMAIGTGKDPSVAVAFVLYLVAVRYRWRVSVGALAGALALTVAGAVAGGAALGLDRLGGDRISGVASHIVTSAV